jgi:hypothetical protein
MELCGHREVEAIVLAGVESPQELERVLAATLLFPECLCAADGEVADGARTRPATKLGQGGAELGIDGDLDAGVRSCHHS